MIAGAEKGTVLEERTEGCGYICPEQLPDYLEHADTIEFLWRATATSTAVVAAKWDGKTLQVIDKVALKALQTYHDSKVGDELKWEKFFK